MSTEALQETAPKAGCEALWTVKDVAKYLQRSPRWVWGCLTHRPDESGSIPHIRLPGKTPSPRFVPDEVRDWAALNFPPARDFKAWRDRKK